MKNPTVKCRDCKVRRHSAKFERCNVCERIVQGIAPEAPLPFNLGQVKS